MKASTLLFISFAALVVAFLTGLVAYNLVRKQLPSSSLAAPVSVALSQPADRTSSEFQPRVSNGAALARSNLAAIPTSWGSSTDRINKGTLAKALLPGVWENPKQSWNDRKTHSSEAAAPVRIAIGAPNSEHQRESEDAERPYDGAVSVTGDFDDAALPKVVKKSPTHFALDFNNGEPHMFFFRVRGAKGRLVRFDLENVNATKWRTLNPVINEQVRSSNDLYSMAEPHDAQYSQISAYNGPVLDSTDAQQWRFARDVWQSGEIQFHLLKESHQIQPLSQ